ncbi:MAG: ATP-dependent Clp protease proteolytic subunit [Oscillospiraceae bacterium]
MSNRKKLKLNDFTAPADPFKTPDYVEQESNELQSEDDTSDELKQITETGSITVEKDGHYIHCLTIIGQIEGHYILPSQNKTTKYEHVIPRLVAIEESDEIEGLIIILNTVGGDIEAGLAIAELVAGMKTPTVSLVLGGGHSIGVPLAVSAKHSFITPSATMTIHPVRLNGLVLGVPQTLSYFDKMQERIIKFITKNSKMDPDRFRQLMLKTGELVMDVGTVLEGEKAVEEGLIDSIGSLSDALTCLYDMIEKNPKQKRSIKDKKIDNTETKDNSSLKVAVEKTQETLEYRKEKESKEEI